MWRGMGDQGRHGPHLSLTNSWMEESYASALEKLLKLNFEVRLVVLIENHLNYSRKRKQRRRRCTAPLMPNVMEF